MTIATHWRVEVYADGEQILAIEPDMIAGADITPDYADTIRHCADHLRGFVGPEWPQVCFCCGGFGYEYTVYDGRIPCHVCSEPNFMIDTDLGVYSNPTYPPLTPKNISLCKP